MEVCDVCLKVRPLCLCGSFTPRDNRVEVVILQHPQEPDKDLGSARLTELILKKSKLKTALSVPNLKKVLGREVDLNRWVVLFLGSKYKFREIQRRENESDLYLFDRKGDEIPFPRDQIEGIVAIDGTWAQAKTLWWRNPWLVKLKRAVLNPRSRSLYGNLRREPRRECLSTIESIAYTLETLGEGPEVVQELLSGFQTLVTKYKEFKKNPPAQPQE